MSSSAHHRGSRRLPAEGSLDGYSANTPLAASHESPQTSDAASGSSVKTDHTGAAHESSAQIAPAIGNRAHPEPQSQSESSLTAPLILAFETSCDETAAAVVRGGREVLSNVIATQHDLHEEYAGVVPEIASRAHLERLLPVMRSALREANVTAHQLDAVAVGHRPGLIGSLLVGVSAAKALAWSLNRPLIGVDHLAAHLYAGLLDADRPAFPALGLVVSGGHTTLFLVHSPLEMQRIGQTRDDAVGEAFDKAATILQLGYPGGPAIDALAQLGDDRAHDFPITRMREDKDGGARPRFDFSFSGLKTAVLYAVRGQPDPRRRGESPQFASDASMLTAQEKADFAASFQRAAVIAVLFQVRAAVDAFSGVRTLLVGGGVSANSRLRRELQELASARSLELRLPKFAYCLDNAAMIAGLAAEHLRAGRIDDLSLHAEPSAAF